MMRWVARSLVVVTIISLGFAGFFGLRADRLAKRVEALEKAAVASPYAANLESQGILALSAQEITDLLEGNGMGLARAAELNRYPGPKHLLDAQMTLSLSSEQVQAVRDLQAPMKALARELGTRVLVEERRLEEMFRGGTVTEEALASQVEAIERLQAELRLVHLRTHLDTLPLLTPEQTQHYQALRGYQAPGSGMDHSRSH